MLCSNKYNYNIHIINFHYEFFNFTHNELYTCFTDKWSDVNKEVRHEGMIVTLHNDMHLLMKLNIIDIIICRKYGVPQ